MSNYSNRAPRGSGRIVALTVRLERDDWIRLRQLAAEEGSNLQALVERGLSRVLNDLGRPAIQHPARL